MSRRLASSIGIAALAAGLAIAGRDAAGADPPRRESYSDRYSILTEQNIFLRDRSRPGNRPGPTTQRAPAIPEETFILTGVAIEDEGELRAYVEDTTAARVLRLSESEGVARGTILRIEIDGLEYQQEGAPASVWVQVGRNFMGQPAAPAIASGGAGPTTSPSEMIDPNDPNLTLEQRMKLRRQQQMNR